MQRRSKVEVVREKDEEGLKVKVVRKRDEIRLRVERRIEERYSWFVSLDRFSPGSVKNGSKLAGGVARSGRIVVYK